jgi:hypothetical protein
LSNVPQIQHCACKFGDLTRLVEWKIEKVYQLWARSLVENKKSTKIRGIATDYADMSVKPDALVTPQAN